jgi:chemotaxis protein CheD
MAEENWVVGIAECKITRSPNKLVAYGLGSCVGVILCDLQAKVGGLAHIMLPSSLLYIKTTIPGKFADTAIDMLVTEMEKLGCCRKNFISKIVGGANMFSLISQKSVPIGLRNVSAVREKLQQLNIPILAEQVGGTQGRTAILDVASGRVEIRKLNRFPEWV